MYAPASVALLLHALARSIRTRQMSPDEAARRLELEADLVERNARESAPKPADRSHLRIG